MSPTRWQFNPNPTVSTVSSAKTCVAVYLTVKSIVASAVTGSGVTVTVTLPSFGGITSIVLEVTRTNNTVANDKRDGVLVVSIDQLFNLHVVKYHLDVCQYLPSPQEP